MEFRGTIEIARAAADVFDFIANFENNPRWQGGMRACRWTSRGPIGVGSTYVQEARFLGRRIDTHFRVTEYEQGRSISIESTKSTFPIQVTRSVEPIDAERCRVSAHVRGQPKGIVKLLSGMATKMIAKDYEALKRLLEDSGASTGRHDEK
jgi:carbon monoxide dehydrogenase subunit G